tara:strand:- start:434 stop:1342 length:909 start_codon:yes stop_codon:yes gene_type:complete
VLNLSVEKAYPLVQKNIKKELLLQTENLVRSYQQYVNQAQGLAHEDAVVYGFRALIALANMVIEEREVFAIEPWHLMSLDAPLSCPGEMLLRVRDYRGDVIPPYPAVMAFYNHGFTAQLDNILFLAALDQFMRSDERQVSINVSARSLRDRGFVTSTLECLSTLELGSDEKIIIEIHESTPHVGMNQDVLKLYHNLGVSFALDDVGLNINDIMRIGEFDGIADYIKIDRHAVCAENGASNSLENVVSFVESLMPKVTIVAEGVQDAHHAIRLRKRFPEIAYVQGLYLPSERSVFKRQLIRAQ